MSTNRFTARLDGGDEYRRNELIARIEHAVERMKVAELEALAYDMFTKGYLDE